MWVALRDSDNQVLFKRLALWSLGPQLAGLSFSSRVASGRSGYSERMVERLFVFDGWTCARMGGGMNSTDFFKLLDFLTAVTPYAAPALFLVGAFAVNQPSSRTWGWLALVIGAIGLIYLAFTKWGLGEVL